MNDNINKEELSQFLDSDGKIIITDSMPEDIKKAINYLNENNIGLFDEIQDTEEEEDAMNEMIDESDDDFEPDESDDDTEIDENVELDETDADPTTVQDLENLF